LKYPTVEMVLALGTDADHFEFYFDRMSPSYPIREVNMGDQSIAVPPGATTSELKKPVDRDVADAWKVLDSWLSPGDYNEGYKEWVKEFKPKFLKAVERGKLSKWPMEKAVKTFKIADYKRKVSNKYLDNPIIVATYPGATYQEVLDGSHRLLQRYKAGLKDVPVFLINLPWWADDLSDAVDAYTIEDLLPLK
jgi:ParB-like nuclease domain